MRHSRIRVFVSTLMAMSGLALSYAEDAFPMLDHVSNWPAPLYWRATAGSQRHAAGERMEEGRVTAQAVGLQLNLSAVFVAITPCRLVDTRLGSLPFGSPPLAAEETRVYPVPSGSCGLPGTALAYSFNIAVVPTGATMRWLTAWPDGQPKPTIATLNDYAGLVTSNFAIVAAGDNGAIDIFVKDTTNLIIDVNGYYTATADNGQNTALGIGALANRSGNTAIGNDALLGNTTGVGNMASGYNALSANTTGYWNTASGASAHASNTTGVSNTATGLAALVGNTTGNYNTATGTSALGFNTTGDNNIAIGNLAAQGVSGGNSNNIHIGSFGSPGDSSTIRIGGTAPADPVTQTQFFASGIRGVTTGNNDAIPVLIDSNGQLGTASSSRTVKRDIEDMGDTTGTIMGLRPVRFRYRAHGPDSPFQYGLIAEEVAEIAPDLVVHNARGEIETVYYDKVNAIS